MDIEYYMKLQNAHGTKNRREKELVKINHQMSKHFEDTFDTEEVLLNGKPFKLMIIHDTEGNAYKKKIKSKHDDKFNLGDYITWNGQIWLVTLLDSDEKTWNRGYMYQCSILLRWQNEKGKIVERWCYSEDFTKYSTGITRNNTITLGDYQYGVTLPVDDETKIMKRDKRFPIDIEGVEPPDIYRLTNRKILLTDDRAFNRGGILTWTLSFAEFNKNTDKKITLPNGSKVWICDYHSPTLPSKPEHSDEMPDLRAHIHGERDLKLGFPRSYEVTLSDVNNTPIKWENVSCNWNIVGDFDITSEINGNTISLAVNDESLIGETFLLQVIQSEDKSVIGELKINIVDVV